MYDLFVVWGNVKYAFAFYYQRNCYSLRAQALLGLSLCVNSSYSSTGYFMFIVCLALHICSKLWQKDLPVIVGFFQSFFSRRISSTLLIMSYHTQTWCLCFQLHLNICKTLLELYFSWYCKILVFVNLLPKCPLRWWSCGVVICRCFLLLSYK